MSKLLRDEESAARVKELVERELQRRTDALQAAHAEQLAKAKASELSATSEVDQLRAHVEELRAEIAQVRQTLLDALAEAEGETTGQPTAPAAASSVAAIEEPEPAMAGFSESASQPERATSWLLPFGIVLALGGIVGFAYINYWQPNLGRDVLARVAADRPRPAAVGRPVFPYSYSGSMASSSNAEMKPLAEAHAVGVGSEPVARAAQAAIVVRKPAEEPTGRQEPATVSASAASPASAPALVAPPAVATVPSTEVPAAAGSATPDSTDALETPAQTAESVPSVQPVAPAIAQSPVAPAVTAVAEPQPAQPEGAVTSVPAAVTSSEAVSTAGSTDEAMVSAVSHELSAATVAPVSGATVAPTSGSPPAAATEAQQSEVLPTIAEPAPALQLPRWIFESSVTPTPPPLTPDGSPAWEAASAPEPEPAPAADVAKPAQPSTTERSPLPPSSSGSIRI